MTLRIGCTGTKSGMTSAQVAAVDGMLWNLGGPSAVRRTSAAHIHIGDCVGADEQFHAAAVRHGLWTVGHPPLNPSRRAFCRYDEVRAAADYLERDANIARECDVLLAAPKAMIEQIRSGTWATIRRARELAKPILMIFPSGAIVPDDNYLRWAMGR